MKSLILKVLAISIPFSVPAAYVAADEPSSYDPFGTTMPADMRTTLVAKGYLGLTGGFGHPLPSQEYRLVLAETESARKTDKPRYGETESFQIIKKDYFGDSDYVGKSFSAISFKKGPPSWDGFALTPPLQKRDVGLWFVQRERDMGQIDGSMLARKDDTQAWRDALELAKFCQQVAASRPEKWLEVIKPHVTSKNRLITVAAVNMIGRLGSPEAYAELEAMAVRKDIDVFASIALDKVLAHFAIAARTPEHADVFSDFFRTWHRSEERQALFKRLATSASTDRECEAVLWHFQVDTHDGPHAQENRKIFEALARDQRFGVEVRKTAVSRMVGALCEHPQDDTLYEAVIKLLESGLEGDLHEHAASVLTFRPSPINSEARAKQIRALYKKEKSARAKESYRFILEGYESATKKAVSKGSGGGAKGE